LFADYTSLLITSPNPTNFTKSVSGAVTHINDWIKANLSLNLEKTDLIQFLTKDISHIPMHVGCDINIKSTITKIKCSGIMIDNTLT
jgi:hypothetical protein